MKESTKVYIDKLRRQAENDKKKKKKKSENSQNSMCQSFVGNEFHHGDRFDGRSVAGESNDTSLSLSLPALPWSEMCVISSLCY